jgi:hypothetical protein
MHTIKNLIRGEAGQVVPIFAMLALVILALLGLAADIGKIYVARAQLSRAVDAAALAGAKELPDLDEADLKARAYIAENEPDADVEVDVYPDVDAQQVGVTAQKRVETVFMRVFGRREVTIEGEALAGFGGTPLDAVMVIDATGSMGASPCNGSQNNSGCPIWEAKQAALSFVDTLLPSPDTVIGSTAYRGCFNAPNPNSGCVQLSTIASLTGNVGTLNSRINSITSVGGTGTNVCLGLDKSAEILTGSGSHSAANTKRVVVILTDGDNTMNGVARVSGHPPAACRPAANNSNLGSACQNTTEAAEGELDTKTKARADALKATGVEIYVVGFGVCGSSSSAQCNTANVGRTGSSFPDSTADRNLLKCVASSSANTNDHYYEATSASQLPQIFTQIAQTIAFRLIK